MRMVSRWRMQRMHANAQNLIMYMFKKAKIWAIRNQNIFRRLVPADDLK